MGRFCCSEVFWCFCCNEEVGVSVALVCIYRSGQKCRGRSLRSSYHCPNTPLLPSRLVFCVGVCSKRAPGKHDLKRKSAIPHP